MYAKLVGTFPFNSFLAGFFCCVGAFVVSATGGRQQPLRASFAVLLSATPGLLLPSCCPWLIESLTPRPPSPSPMRSLQLTVSLRMKVSEGGSSSGPREFGGYAFAMLTLFIAAWNYVG